jgi:hypothetical protein
MKVSMGRLGHFEDYDPEDPDIEYRKNRWDFWEALKQIRQEFLETLPTSVDQLNLIEFSKYVEENYGLKIHIIDEKITDKYEIVDEKLYVIFLLKWI